MGSNHLDHQHLRDLPDKERLGHRELWGKEEGRRHREVVVVGLHQMVLGMLLDMEQGTGEGTGVDKEVDRVVGKEADKDRIVL